MGDGAAMIWNVLRGLGIRIKSSLWFIPFVAIPLAMVAIRLVHALDARLEWKFLDLEIPGAQAMLQAIVSANLSFLVFTFASLLVAIQIASAQLSPRIIATTLLSDRTIKYCVGVFFFTLLFAIGAQNRIEKDVSQLVAFIAASLGVICFAAFFYLIDHASRLLRPVSVLSQVGNRGLDVIANVYPKPGLGPDSLPHQQSVLGDPSAIIRHTGGSGIVVFVDIPVLLEAAERARVVIEFAPQIGDFVAADEPIFSIYGKGTIDAETLRAAVDFGSERTMVQDPTFAFRITVDIALRALSAAINDPTTAVLAIDQLHRMLRAVGKRHLHTDEHFGKDSQLRLIFRTPNWEDFVYLSVREIRRSGASNFQVVRRLRSMIDNLLQTLPAYRLPAIAEELKLLDRELEEKFPYPEDLALARIGDPQGLGGRSGMTP